MTLSRAERLYLLAIGIALSAAFVLFPGPLLYYDAHVLVPELYAGTLGSSNLSRNFLILPLGHAICSATGLAPEDALGLLCAIAGAVAPLAIYVGLRRLGYGGLPAAFAAALLVLAPHPLFFALHVEKHGPHLAACCIAFAVAARPRAERTTWRGALAPAIAGVLVIGTHASGFLRWPFLAWMGASRSRGPRAWAWVASGIGAAALCMGCACFLYGYLRSWWSIPDEGPLRGLAQNVISHWNFDPRGMLAYTRHTFLPGAALLLPLGLAGALLARREHRRVALPMLAWFLCDLYAYAAYGWVKMGGHVLATYVTLALGAAECARRAQRAPRAIFVALLLAVLGAQAYFGARLALADASKPHPLVWARDLRAATGDRGMLITDWQSHHMLCGLHTRLAPISLVDIGYLAPAAWPSALRTLGDVIEQKAREGVPVYLDGELDELAAERAELAEFLRVLRERFLLVDVSRGGFRGARLESRR